MSIGVNWNKEDHSLISFCFSDGWTWQDLFDAQAEAGRLISMVQHEVDFLLDLRAISTAPSNPLRPFHLIIKQHPSNLRKIYVLGANRLLKTLMEAYSTMNPALRDTLIFVERHPCDCA